jgi:hypothetical protein
MAIAKFGARGAGYALGVDTRPPQTPLQTDFAIAMHNHNGCLTNHCASNTLRATPKTHMMISECPESVDNAVCAYEHTALRWNTTVDRFWLIIICRARPITLRSCDAGAPSHNGDEWLAMVPQAA